MKSMETVFTQEELQMIYAACMVYGNKLSDMAKEIPNETQIVDSLADRAKEAWRLARKVADVSK